MSGAKLAGELRRDLHRDGAIHQQTIFVAHREEQPGVGAACANRQKNVAVVAKCHRLSCAQVGGEHP